MSLWNQSCYEEYNNTWLNISGALTQKENNEIKRFKTIIRNQYEDLIKFVFQKRKILNQPINHIFKTTECRFQKIWDNIEKDLPKAKYSLGQILKNNRKNIKIIIEKLKIFYRSGAVPKITNIHIILLPKTIKSGGGKFIPQNNILIEGNVQRFNKTRTLEIILHEMIHLYFEGYLKQYLYPKFSKRIEYHQLKELIASSLLPMGCLSSLVFGASSDKNSSNPKLIELSRQYIQKNKPIDTKFIENLLECIKK
jgi:hypothetical protein